MGDVPPAPGQPAEMPGDTGCGRNLRWVARKAATAAAGERPASHQLVGGAKAHLGNDGYPD